MPVLDKADGGGEDERVRAEDGLGVAVAEGSALIKPVTELLVERGGVELGVDGDEWGKEAGGEDGCAVGAEAAAEEIDVRSWKGEADGVRVTAEAMEEGSGGCLIGGGGMRGGDGVEEVEAGDGATGAVRIRALAGEDEGGAAGAIDDA